MSAVYPVARCVSISSGSYHRFPSVSILSRSYRRIPTCAQMDQELIVKMLQPEAHQGVRDLLPVDGVQVDVPLVLTRTRKKYEIWLQ